MNPDRDCKDCRRPARRRSFPFSTNARSETNDLPIAGCNGAGKTTFAKEFLPHEVKCLRFYNADEFARGLSPLDPPAAAIKAGRLLLAEIRQSISRKETFALESTLSGRTHIRIFQRAVAAGYEIELHHL